MKNIDPIILDQALKQVAWNRFATELRNAIAFGPPIIGEVFKAYTDLEHSSKRKKQNGKLHTNKK